MEDQISGQLCMIEAAQMTEEHQERQYQQFVDKFKQAKTTDDCYTPPAVYDAVADWVAHEYGVDKARFVRPFWPGADYQAFDYPPGCVVVDNPPFSLFAQIMRFYVGRGIDFFLFGPSLTLFSGNLDICYIPADTTIEYENGATVKTGFSTSLEPGTRIRSAPTLYRAVTDAVDAMRKEKRVELPKYTYPDHVCTAAMVQRYSHYGVDFRVPASEAAFIRYIDSQKAQGKHIFGGGYLLSERAAAERAAAIKWQLSPREWAIIQNLTTGGGAMSAPTDAQRPRNDGLIPGQIHLEETEKG